MCGKTYTLREIGRVPQQQEKYSQYLCVGISFNGATEKHDSELRLVEQFPDFAGQIFAIPRLIFSLFVKDAPWANFSSAFSSAFSVVYRMMSMTNNDMIQLLTARIANKFEIVLLVDEISKLKSDKYVESTRSYLCKLIIQSNFSYCIFSSLYFKLITDTKTYETPTGRQRRTRLLPVDKDVRDSYRSASSSFGAFGYV